MTRKDQRRPAPSSEVNEELIDDAIAQLNVEIELLQGWLQDTENVDNGDPKHKETRLAYRDKLRSRSEMREALLNQRKNLERKNSNKKS